MEVFIVSFVTSTITAMTILLTGAYLSGETSTAAHIGTQPDMRAIAAHFGIEHSPGHRKNILDPNFRRLGVAYGTGVDGRTYWAQSFGA